MSIYSTFMFLALIGPPAKPILNLELALNPYQKESRAILNELARNTEELQWIKCFYSIKITDVTESNVLKSPRWRINRSNWEEWPKHENFPKGVFNTTGFVFRTIQYELYQELVKTNHNFDNLGANLLLNRIRPFPHICIYISMPYDEDRPSKEFLDQFKNESSCIYYYNKGFGNMLVTNKDGYSRAFNIINDRLVLLWTGRVNREALTYHYKPSVLEKRPTLRDAIRGDILDKYWGLRIELDRIDFTPIGNFQEHQIDFPVDAPL